jgi:hypothetical protein
MCHVNNSSADLMEIIERVVIQQLQKNLPQSSDCDGQPKFLAAK